MSKTRKAKTGRKPATRRSRRPAASIAVRVKWPKGAAAHLKRIGTLAGVAASGLNRLAQAQETFHRSLQRAAITVEPAAITGDRFVRLAADGKPTDGLHIAVYDRVSGLTWSAAPLQDGKELNHADAMKACKELDLLGHKDWRAPTVTELLALIDYERNDPAVDPANFKGPYSYTWSSTPYKGASGCAWYVSLRSGNSSWINQDDQYHARAVRAGQPLGLTE